MARDEGLEALLSEDLQDERGLSEKAMFGGVAWLLNDHLLCGARADGLLIRLGKDKDAWALALPGHRTHDDGQPAHAGLGARGARGLW